MKTTDNATVIDLPALRKALETLGAHRELVAAAITDMYTSNRMTASVLTVNDVVAGLRHIVEDDYRSTENRGGG
jgi:hypothetical protein